MKSVKRCLKENSIKGGTNMLRKIVYGTLKTLGLSNKKSNIHNWEEN